MNENINKTKILAMYLPQYHVIPENSKFWGEGFTDWVSVKNAEPLFEGHVQPKVPIDGYYDLSLKSDIARQVSLAKEFGVSGFCIYHYWFSSQKQLLTRPAEIILQNQDIDFPFCFAWDNTSWKRTWSRFQGNDWAPMMDSQQKKSSQNESEILVEYSLGGPDEWKKHFEFLIPYFRDKRYIKINNAPVFVIFNYSRDIEEMEELWNNLAVSNGFSGVRIIYRFDSRIMIPHKHFSFTYEPMQSAWGSLSSRLIDRIMKRMTSSGPKKYRYTSVWRTIISRASKNNRKNAYYGAFVNYDDTPRRSKQGRVCVGASAQLFGEKMFELLRICNLQKKELLFLTAWNEWSEGAYLEPDEINGFDYLIALKDAINRS